jgi:hypothetical protein
MSPSITPLGFEPRGPLIVLGGEAKMSLPRFGVLGDRGGSSFLLRSATVIIQFRFHCGTPR